MNPDALNALLEAAQASRSTALVIWQQGNRALEWWFQGQPRAIEAMSVTKSVVNLIVGRAVTLGLIESAETPVHHFYPEWRQGRKRDITLRHLMDHSSGLQNHQLTTSEIYPSPDFVKLALAAELEDMPGARFTYNNKAVNLLAGVIAKATGHPMHRFAHEALFQVLDIAFDWARDEAGNPHGMSGLQLQPRDLAKLGYLVLQDGLWNDQRLIDENWIRSSLSISNDFAPFMGWSWWLRHHTGIITVGEQHLNVLVQLGATASQVRQYESLLGQYDTLESFWQRWNEQVGDALDDYGGRIKWYDAAFTALRSCSARGSLGQYLVIVPEHKLVAVRMLEWFPGAEQARYGFEDFETRILGLCA